jgi:hypothetical protein
LIFKNPYATIKVISRKILEKDKFMEDRIYIVSRIEGEYAYVCDKLDPSEELFIALALLPLGADIGDELKYENGELVAL